MVTRPGATRLMNQHISQGMHPDAGVEQAHLEVGSLIRHNRSPLEPRVQSLNAPGCISKIPQCHAEYAQK